MDCILELCDFKTTKESGLEVHMFSQHYHEKAPWMRKQLKWKIQEHAWPIVEDLITVIHQDGILTFLMFNVTLVFDDYKI